MRERKRKMAASLYTWWRVIACNPLCSSNVVLFQVSQRWYARGIKRTPVTARTPDGDRELSKAKGIHVKDSKKNPWVPFVSGDPTQEQFINGKVKLTRQHNQNVQSKSKHQVVNKPIAKTISKPVLLKRDSVSVVLPNGLQYEKLEEGDKRLSQVILAAKSQKDREKKGIILLEGRRLIVDALKAGVWPKYVYFSDVNLLSGLPAPLFGNAKLFKVQYKHLKMWADTESPAGLLGIFAKPAAGEVLCPQLDGVPITVVCDQVTDPGNMGNIIRTAAAAGCKQIITAKGSVDVWDPKVLRSAMGGHFYTSILHSLPWEQIVNHLACVSHICITEPRKGSIVEKSFDVNHPKVIEMIDTDSDWSDDEKKEGCTVTDLDRLQDDEKQNTYHDSDTESESESGKWSRLKSKPYKKVPLSVVPYSSIDCYEAEEVAVIVGGETTGVSAQARKFAFESYGQFVTVPMVEAVDSLNTATAFGIVLYEIRRQLTYQSAAVKTKNSQGSKTSVPPSHQQR